MVMVRKYQQLGVSSLVCISLSLLGFGAVASAAESAKLRSTQHSETKYREQRPDRKPERPRINFVAAAAKLGTTEAKLKAALGLPAQPPQPGNMQGQPRNETRPAERGQPERGKSEHRKPEHRRPHPPRLDIKGAAVKLGVTEQKLIQALGLPEKPPMPGQAMPGQAGAMPQPK
jgi:hypothetical protein